MVTKKPVIDFVNSPSELPKTAAEREAMLTRAPAPQAPAAEPVGQPVDQAPASEAVGQPVEQTAAQPARPGRRSRKASATVSPSDRVCTVAIRLSKEEYLEVHDFCHQIFKDTGVITSMATVGKEALLKHVRKGAR